MRYDICAFSQRVADWTDFYLCTRQKGCGFDGYRRATGRRASGARKRGVKAVADAETLAADAVTAGDENQSPSIAEIWRAQEVVRPHVRHTPVLPSRTLSAMTGANEFLKAENLQRSGAFKIRGATYKLSRLTG